VRLSAFDAECVFCVDDTLEVLLPTDFGASLVDYVHGALPLNSADRILDVGCGSGIYPITLARRGYADITAIDVNQEAILQTTRNMQRNCVKAAAVRLVYADVCSFDLERPYDLVVSNPSHLPAHPDYDLGRGIDVAALAGPDGRKMYDAIIDRATELVAPGGRLLLAHSSLANVPRTLERLEEIGFHTSVAMRNEMDIPLLAYEPHRNLLFSQLERLARHGAAEFAGDRFWVYIVDATKA
jgi:release factor glutamine methyltransferase